MLQASYSEDKLTGSSRLGVNNSAHVGKRLLGGAYKRNKSDGITPFFSHYIGTKTMKKQTCIIGNILLLMMFLLLSMTAKAEPFTSRVGGDPIYLPDPNVPSPYTLMWAQYSYAGSELYVVNNKVTIEKYFVGTIYVECYYKCVRQYTVAGHVYEDHQTNTTYFGIKCDPVYTTGLPDQLTMQVGETKTIDWSYRPPYVSRPNLTWTSSDYSVVDVNSNRLTAKKSGRAVVTVKSNAGPDEYINVTVEGGSDVIYVNSISLNETSVSLTEGSTKQLQATVLPSNATDKSVSWSSSNNSVAEVSSSGLVTAKSTGTATITCKANDGSGKSATCSVTVNSSIIEPTSISLPSSKTVKVGESFTMTYTLTPSNATTTLTWSSDDTSIATVSSSGDVKGIKAGTTKIRVKTSNGKTDYCNVTVENNSVEPTSISLPSSKTVKVGESFTMTYTLTPSNATTTLTWSSDDTSIATVSSSGVVKGVKAGTTKIRVKTTNDKTDYCSVSVEANTKLELSASPSGGQVSAGTKVTLTAKANGSTVSDCDIYYTTDGTTPSKSNGKEYSSGITINNDCTLKAIAYKSGYEDSNVLTASYTIENTKKVNPTSIRVSRSSLSMKVTDTYEIIYYYDYPEGTPYSLRAEPSVTWSSNNNNVITLSNISPSCEKLTANSIGIATITVKSDNGLSAKCEVDVISQPELPKWEIKQVSAGGYHTMILMTDGTLWACGYNKYGQLGDGTSEDRSILTQIMTNVAYVSAGGYHTMILKTDGTLWACGKNEDGQLGDGTTTNRYTPIQVMADVDFVSASSLANLGEGYTMILRNDGVLFGCGHNFYGELGVKGWESRSTPVEIMDNVASVSAGGNHTMIIKNDGTLWACGVNGNGQLGDNTTIHQSVCTLKPIMNGVANVSAGDAHTLVLRNDGTLCCFGSNYYGQASIDMTRVATMSAGGSHSIIVKTNGSLWAAGYNNDGQLGDCTNVDRHTVVMITDVLNVEQLNLATSSAGFSTFFDSESAYVLPSGLLAQVVTGASNSKLTYKTIADGSVSGVVPKSVPVMLVSDSRQAGTFTLTSSESTATYTGTNLLRGSDEPTTTTGEGLHYKLSYGPTGTKWDDVFGWYWGTQNGAPFQIEGHKAWLVIPKSGTRAAGFTIEGDVLGIESLEELSDQPSDLYFDLQGRRLNQPTKRGVYIKNGMKVIFK